jgi:hypothetical protein
MAVGFSVVQGAVAVIVIPFPARIPALQRPGAFAILVRGQERTTRVALGQVLISMCVQVPVNSQKLLPGQSMSGDSGAIALIRRDAVV